MAAPTAEGIVILCRPTQLREAAIVLSCCVPGRFTPLIVVEPAPLSEAEYRTRYDRYVAVRDQRDTRIGTASARSDVPLTLAALNTLKLANEAVDTAAATLTAYRSWWRHQRMVAELLAPRPPARAILLFEPADNEFELLDAIPMSRIGDTRLPTLPATTARVRLAVDDLAALPQAAWIACQRSGLLPEGVGVAGDSTADWLDAMWQAFRAGQPIRPGAGCLAAPQPDADEAVLVEVADHAERLIGVQYAQVRNARLVLTPEPDTAAIDAAIASMQNVADGKLFGALKEYLFADPAVSAGLRRIEQAVSAAVPDAVIEAVGGRDLTAFTTGMPYSFVRRGKADWSAKPIGHVSGDASLLILTELLGVPDDAPEGGGAGFSLIFDPGYFKTPETQDVLAKLSGRLSRPLVLDGPAAAGLSLLRLAALPLDILYFNTHGSDREILLADGPMPAFKIQQRLRLRSRPFVFNSSCLSWVGVGREFVRVGARGYAGTLWSVNAGHASAYARIVLDRVTGQGWPVARAMRRTEIDRATEMAYIYAGSVSARLATRPDTPARAQPEIAAAAQILLYQISDSLETNGSGPAQIFTYALQDRLWREVDALLQERSRQRPQPDAATIEIAALRLSVLSRLVARRKDLVADAAAIYGWARPVLDALKLDAATQDRLAADLTLQAGRLCLALNQPEAAVPLLGESVERAGSHPVPALLSLCDARRLTGDPAGALQAAIRARDAAATAEQPGRSRLLALGRIVQLTRAAGDAEAALDGAQEGFALATRLDDLGERALFKGDEARALLQLRRFEEAAKAARDFRTLAQRAYNDQLDLSACGLLTGALTALGQHKEATQMAEAGLVNAKALGATESTGDFLLNLWTLRGLDNDNAGAMDAALEAAGTFASIGRMPRVREALGRATEAFKLLSLSAGPSGAAAALFRKAGTELELLGHVTPELQTAIVTETVNRFSRLIREGPNAETAAGVAALAARCQSMFTGPAADQPIVLKFLSLTFTLFHRLALGQRDGARDLAAQADALTTGHAGLVALVDSLS